MLLKTGLVKNFFTAFPFATMIGFQSDMHNGFVLTLWTVYMVSWYIWNFISN